jgi:hypothetical protein
VYSFRTQNTIERKEYGSKKQRKKERKKESDEVLKSELKPCFFFFLCPRKLQKVRIAKV